MAAEQRSTRGYRGGEMERYIAVDLGAESGRVIVGMLGEGRVALTEVHRFANTPVRTPDGLHWDALRIYADVLTGLRAASARYGGDFAGIGVDSWGVDYGLLDGGGRLLGNPYHYRDARTDGMPEVAARQVPAEEQYARTGIAQMPINTIYQLLATVRGGDRSLELAQSLLMIPDLLHYWLSGTASAERTEASTSGALGADGRWASDLLARLAIPTHMLLPPAAPGTSLGEVRAAVRDECGLGPVPVILPATHDTASAVIAVPAAGTTAGRHAYLSSGTWSLLGLELDRPILNEEARRAGFTNEHGAGGTYRFLSNIMGLWLVQECRRAWARQGTTWTYEELTQRAAAVASPEVVIDANDPAFLHPDDMPAAVRSQLTRTGQDTPGEPALLVRAILEGLALACRVKLAGAERLAGVHAETLHIVGGGARNSLLCQLTADACGRPVLAGPTEATALGNVLVQAVGMGALGDWREARTVARASADVVVYEPQGDIDWAARQEQLLAHSPST
jgi:rhamnulokinase